MSESITNLKPSSGGSGGSGDPINVSEILGYGPAGTPAQGEVQRPAASAANKNYLWFTTDLDDGRMTQSNGVAWVNRGPGVSTPPPVHAHPTLGGWEYLGGHTLAADANVLPPVTIAARGELQIVIRHLGFNLNDQPAIRFNADAGNNYAYRLLNWGITVVTPAANDFAASQSMARIGINLIRPRQITLMVNNFATQAKGYSLMPSAVYSATTSNEPQITMGAGSWANVVNQITSVQLITVGANNIIAGTAIYIFGKDV